MVETRSKATEEHVKKLDHQLQVYMAETTKKFDSIDSKIDDLGKKMDLLMSKLFATQDDEVAFSWARFIMVEACICSIDCQCYSCHDDCSRRNEVKNCTLSIDCNCDSCFDGCSRKINEGENQVEVVDSTLEFVELEDQLSEGVLTEKDNELNKLFTMKDWKSNGTLKLFDELLELELVHISCLFAGSSFYIHDEKNDGANIVFDPGGRVFDWLNQLNKCVEIEVSRQIPVGVDLESFFYKRCNVGQLVKCKQKFYMSLNFYVSEIPLYVYSQGYVSTYITIDATSVKGWTMKQFIKVLDDYLRNIKHDSELLYTSLACVLLGWDIILGVEWTYCPSKVVHRSQVMTSVEVVKYKGSLVAFGVIFEDTKSLLQGLRENIIVSISSSSFRVMKVSSFGNGYGVFEVVHVDKGVTAIGNPGALRSKNISTLHWKQLIMFKLHEHLHSVQTVYILSCTMPPVSWWKIMLPFTTLKTLAMKYWLMIPLYLKFQIYVDNIHNREGKRPNHKMHWRTFFDLVALEFDDFVIIVTLLVTWVLEVTTCMEEFKFQVLKFPFNDRPIEGISNHVLVEPRLLLQAAKGFGIADLTDLYCYRSWDGGTTAIENLLSGDDLQHMLSSLKILGLHKEIKNAIQRTITQYGEGMFSVSETLKGGLELVLVMSTLLAVIIKKMGANQFPPLVDCSSRYVFEVLMFVKKQLDSINSAIKVQRDNMEMNKRKFQELQKQVMLLANQISNFYCKIWRWESKLEMPREKAEKLDEEAARLKHDSSKVTPKITCHLVGQLVKASFEQLIHLNYCHWHWRFCGCSNLSPEVATWEDYDLFCNPSSLILILSLRTRMF